MHCLFEDDGELKAGTIISESDASAQIETASGRRLKIKLATIILRFASPSAESVLDAAKKAASEIDLSLLWESVSDADLTFSSMAKEYFGASASAQEQANTLVALMGNPMYFRKRGKGLFRRAPESELKAALAGMERKKQEALQMQGWVDALVGGRLPEVYGTPPNAMIDRLLYAPDKNLLTTKAVLQAAEQARQTPELLLKNCGAIPSAHDFHFRRFLFHTFPKGIAFPETATQKPENLPTARVRAFSIDDEATTEIDDAFSVSVDAQGRTVIGIHIAAPALGIAPGSPLDAIARERLSTVYMPGNKITMLPESVVNEFTLAQGRDAPALSLYATLDSECQVVASETKLERVPIAANLRLQHLTDEIVDPLATTRAPWQDEMIALHRFAKARFAVRGKNEINRLDYNFEVIPSPAHPTDAEHARITLSTRARGSAIDLIVSELMIFANATWGKWLADGDVAGMFRVQGMGKTRMAVNPGPHEGLGVPFYLWSTSPIRRYSDLMNQRQLIALAKNETPPYTKKDTALLSAVADFDATYNQYGDFQQQMETYWCYRWLMQENLTETTGTVIRENLVRFDKLPIVRRFDDLAFSAPGTAVAIRVHSIDLFAPSLSATASILSAATQ
jgi:exoribonuclease II